MCPPGAAPNRTAAWYDGAVAAHVHHVCGGVVSATVSDVAAPGETVGGPRGPSELWLLGQRMEDIRRGQEDLGHRLEKLDAKIDAAAAKLDAKIDAAAEKMDAKIDSMRNFIIIPVMLVLLAAVLAHFVPGL